jgi:hypothetical protein
VARVRRWLRRAAPPGGGPSVATIIARGSSLIVSRSWRRSGSRLADDLALRADEQEAVLVLIAALATGRVDQAVDRAVRLADGRDDPPRWSRGATRVPSSYFTLVRGFVTP